MAILDKLVAVANRAGEEVNKVGIRRPRPNEVGNDIEPFVIRALISLSYFAGTPSTTRGGHKTTGYPDIEFRDEFNRVNYLECKTYNNIDSLIRNNPKSFSNVHVIHLKDEHYIMVEHYWSEYNKKNKNR